MKTWLLIASIWITLHDGTNELVTELGPRGPVTVLSHAMTMAFGESPTQIAVVSYERAAAQSQLRIIDKQTRQVLATWPIPATPVTLLSGAAPDIVLLGEAAYLLTHASILEPGQAIVRNSRGGMFNVVRIALRTGETRMLPLGNVFANPRLCDFGGIPVVTDWAGYSVWRLAPNGKNFIAVIGKDELSDILPAESPERVGTSLPYNARADFVAVPGAGVFRLSKFGLLHRVADPDLKALPAPHASMPVGPAQDIERLLSVTAERKPAIALVRRQKDKRTIIFIDATTLTEIWERELPEGISSYTLVALGPDALVGIDTGKHALVRVSRDRAAVLAALPETRQYGNAHILSAGNP